jgi:CheY-like chemotaxis protein
VYYRTTVNPASINPASLSITQRLNFMAMVTSLPPPQSSAPPKILLAEDNLTNQKVALKQLQSLGYSADVVMDGRQAVKAIIDGKAADTAAYDLLLMDCQMPELDGYEATQLIRAWEAQSQRQRVVIVAMTASDLEVDRQQAIAAGMDDFITKPVRRERLATLLKHWNQVIGTALPAVGAAVASPAPASGASVVEFFQRHLDLNHLHMLSDNSAEFELELLQLFIEDSWAHLVLLQEAIATHNLHQLEQIAHHLKGASANVGAKVMQAAADRLEVQAQRQQLKHSEVLIIQLQNSLQQIQDYLDQHRLHVLSAIS